MKGYKKWISYFKVKIKENQVKHFEINGRHYTCVKKIEGKEILYILFCPELYESQIIAKERKFRKNIEKGNKILTRRKKEKYPSEKGWVQLIWSEPQKVDT